MPTLGSITNKAGFLALLAVNGESLDYLATPGSQAVKVRALVNRNLVKGKDFVRQFSEAPGEFSIANLSQIEFLKELVANEPSAGQILNDSQGYRHRVRLVTQTEYSYSCFCTPSKI